ncbi:MAG: MetQ/NlpA family ABC transporter substrate-binding protein [Spirochaetaceae bacterium]|jgi:D-methionine transport system substrate-binding protein|nr:MetQ/NlpA family ABC transporter substrate-binding protein [Spirochaetaceae bacterium]
MKRLLIMVLALVVNGTLVFARATQEESAGKTVVKLGVMGEELKPAWRAAGAALEKEGITIEFVTFSDYAIPNRALAEGEIDLNSFQHDAFLQNEIKNQKYELSAIGNTVIFFLGVYSHKIKSLDELKDGDTVVIMNDATNGGRALKVLEAAGVFTLDPSKGNTPTIRDIIANPKNIKIVEVDASQTWRTLDDPQVAAAVINSNFVVDGGGVPARDAIYIKPIDKEGDKPYINIVVARTKDKDNPLYKKVVAAFQTDTVAKVVTDEPPLQGTALPAW